MTDFAKDSLVTALRQEFANLAELGDDLSATEWDTATECPGWSVRDMISHVIGTERMLLGEQPPDVEARGEHLKNPIGETNERWIAVRRETPGPAIVAELREVVGRRLATLDAMAQADFDAPSWTPAGQATYGRFMRIRVFDCWIHEQDIRYALDRSGHHEGPIVDLSLDEIEASLPFVVGKRASAGLGQSVRFELSGAAGRRVDVVVGERAALGVIDGEPSVTLATDAITFTRLVGGRIDARDSVATGLVTLGGEADLGSRLLGGLAYMI